MGGFLCGGFLGSFLLVLVSSVGLSRVELDWVGVDVCYIQVLLMVILKIVRWISVGELSRAESS